MLIIVESIFSYYCQYALILRLVNTLVDHQLKNLQSVLLVLSLIRHLEKDETANSYQSSLLAPTFKTYSCLFQHIIFVNHHTTIKNMAFRQFIPEISHSPFSTFTNNHNIQNQHSFINHFGVNLNPIHISRNIQHNNETIENIKNNIDLAQSIHINNNLSSQHSHQKVPKLNDRHRQYKRSTNNSHKKFICVARRLLTRFLQESEKKHFENNFQMHKNSRVYYFIILAHAKLLLSPQNLRDFTNQFLLLLSNKIKYYEKEISETDNHNFINYRYDQIADIQFAIRAFDLYFKEQTQQAIEIIYKRDKTTILKKHQYEQTIKIVNQLQITLKNKQLQKNNQQKSVIVLKQDTIFDREQGTPSIKAINKKNSNICPYSFDSKQEAFAASEIQCKFENKDQMILIQLQNSYPIYDYFYEIMFPYKVDPPIFPYPNLMDYTHIYNPINTYQSSLQKQQQLIKRQGEETTVNKLFLSKTRSDEGNDYKHIQHSL